MGTFTGGGVPDMLAGCTAAPGPRAAAACAREQQWRRCALLRGPARRPAGGVRRLRALAPCRRVQWYAGNHSAAAAGKRGRGLAASSASKSGLVGAAGSDASELDQKQTG